MGMKSSYTTRQCETLIARDDEFQRIASGNPFKSSKAKNSRKSMPLWHAFPNNCFRPRPTHSLPICFA